MSTKSGRSGAGGAETWILRDFLYFEVVSLLINELGGDFCVEPCI